MKNRCVEKFSDFAAVQIERGKSANTIKTYCYALQTFASWLHDSGGNIDKLTRIDLQQYIKHLEAANRSAATIGKVFAAITSFAEFKGCTSITEGIRFPVQRKTLHTAPKSLSRNERNKLLRDAERDGNIRNLALIFTLLFTGLRVSELVSLDRNDIKFGERSGSVTVRKGKGDISRVVPFPVDARHYLFKYLETRTDDEPALFLSQYQQRISVRSVQRMLKQYGIHPHQLRHTYCRELANSGMDLSSIAELAGHSDTNTTRRYSKPSHSELEQAISRVFG
ncbi:tyrosine-type recombinase/integrase [Paenibacillus sp. B01]|uniref:tyrosine-type recombinase/integrase n=1 Tax=Paenibacillus sp. B01 TaxID=2660554 RepID=UPI00129B8ADC|nr:tyrosine-type recombinase/integrase [Paenibacillus sp. B01]QGG57896.1 tyrosine-type recombinase/integrase [Paenibacillus sp. B01]